MEYNVPVSAMALNDEIEGFYILKSANPKVTANGKPFLTGALSDRTGVMEMKVWDYAGPLTAADEWVSSGARPSSPPAASAWRRRTTR